MICCEAFACYHILDTFYRIASLPRMAPSRQETQQGLPRQSSGFGAGRSDFVKPQLQAKLAFARGHKAPADSLLRTSDFASMRKPGPGAKAERCDPEAGATGRPQEA